jgi:hypothetical protein
LVHVTPDILPVASPPFHRGSAIALASAQICDNNFPQTCFFGSVGWQPVKLAWHLLALGRPDFQPGLSNQGLS